jgi:aspartyl protease family protein
MKSIFLILTLYLITLSTSVFSEEIEFKVIALFKNAVMIQHNDKQKMLRSGQTYLQKIKLISADSHQAHFLINGKKLSLGLHQSKIQGANDSNSPQKVKVSVIIPSDNIGMFRTAGFINGVQVKFLVDTGASQVAMNETTARKIGLQYKLKGQKTVVETASGSVSAWFLKLKRINIKGLELKYVDGLVIKGRGPSEVLLGMSFLKQLKIQHDGELLRLTKKY